MLEHLGMVIETFMMNILIQEQKNKESQRKGIQDPTAGSHEQSNSVYLFLRMVLWCV